MGKFLLDIVLSYIILAVLFICPILLAKYIYYKCKEDYTERIENLVIFLTLFGACTGIYWILFNVNILAVLVNKPITLERIMSIIEKIKRAL